MYEPFRYTIGIPLKATVELDDKQAVEAFEWLERIILSKGKKTRHY